MTGELTANARTRSGSGTPTATTPLRSSNLINQAAANKPPTIFTKVSAKPVMMNRTNTNMTTIVNPLLTPTVTGESVTDSPMMFGKESFAANLAGLSIGEEARLLDQKMPEWDGMSERSFLSDVSMDDGRTDLSVLSGIVGSSEKERMGRLRAVMDKENMIPA
jgi:hypothetical protein